MISTTPRAHTGTSDDLDGILGGGEDNDAEPLAACAAREKDRRYRERVRRGE